MAASLTAVRSVNGGYVRQTGLALGIGSLAATLVGVVTAAVAPQLATPGSTAFALSGVMLTMVHAAALVAVAVLAASPAARRGWLKNVGFAAALAGLAAQILGEALIRFDMNLGNIFFTVCMPLMGIGMILVGTAVIRTGTWSGWRRFVPLACGIYIPAVLIPAFMIARGPSFLSLAGFSALYALLGLAMYVESSKGDKRRSIGAV